MRKKEVYFLSLFILAAIFSGCGSTASDERASLETISEEQIKLIKTASDESIDLNSINQFQENLAKGE